MRKNPFKLSVILCVLILTSCSSENEIELTQNNIEIPDTFNEKEIEAEILNRVNNYRIANGFSPLEKLQSIKSQTNNHTNYMIEKEKISHDFFFQRKEYLTKSSNAINVGENVGYGYSTAKSVVNAWIKSEGHKKNMEGDFTHFEVTAEKSAEGKWYFTNIFVKK
ncbi:CAP domain-containing protein [Tenacibaculum finnmarkense]|uniref:CAP domain-containing protein n=1 Tax=Tenacibaculum finnmarkense TaxID=2781243 RepID=UPI00187B806A|nr:CAP domain-containing protein [Tenacibaculum finnmarkense]MBE7649073.1 CAP domain-containing protein [Tenacibaculum finnmarkense genomovar ulcerans]MBE7687429.1 CAP domain-containing protein [Tenacibaculum finnmarkense genomovar ulcerans]MCD8400243.1 CAP domain-containing protein [Tenacibaculum finnmarkense genomovar ulcerans]MCD8432372.1 CAP domain-containing protein [Tenacibaculum finnmarkense genomovar ulcerans]MCD8443767.1 CAP domain-containing protein [Tenacibaculum finnmarkense genomo